MSADLNLLRCLLERKQFTSVYKSIPAQTYDKNTQAMLKFFKSYFDAYDTHEQIDLEVLSSHIQSTTKQTEQGAALIRAMLKQLAVPVAEDVKSVILNALEERRLEHRAALILEQYAAGEEIDLVFELNKIASEAKQRINQNIKADWCDTDVWELIQADADDAGYKLDFLPAEIADNVKGVNEGNNLLFAAPTDKGKTSLLVKLSDSFARQRKAFIPQWEAQLAEMDQTSDAYHRLRHKCRFRPVLYLVNEGTAEVITPRVYQTVLNVNRTKLWELGSAGTVTQDFVNILGRKDAIRLRNVHGQSVAQIARIIEAHDPFLVVTDMTGRIKASSGGNGANDVAQLEEVWNDMRTLAAMMDFIHVGTAQISAEGFDNLFPPLSALQNSKTGVQTTVDFACYMGAAANPTTETELQRGLSTPKNKLVKSGCRSYNTTVTYFDPEMNNWKATQ